MTEKELKQIKDEISNWYLDELEFEVSYDAAVEHAVYLWESGNYETLEDVFISTTYAIINGVL